MKAIYFFKILRVAMLTFAGSFFFGLLSWIAFEYSYKSHRLAEEGTTLAETFESTDHFIETYDLERLSHYQKCVTVIYWVCTTFTSVGYGDIKGSTHHEFMFVMFIEMVGIGFYGYMIGAFQALFMGMSKNED